MVNTTTTVVLEETGLAKRQSSFCSLPYFSC